MKNRDRELSQSIRLNKEYARVIDSCFVFRKEQARVIDSCYYTNNIECAKIDLLRQRLC